MANTQNHRKVPHGLDCHLGSDLVDERFVTYTVHLLSLHSSPYRTAFFSLLRHIFFASVLLFVGRPCIISRVVLSQIVRPSSAFELNFQPQTPKCHFALPNLKFCEPVFTCTSSVNMASATSSWICPPTRTELIENLVSGVGARLRFFLLFLSRLEFHSCVAPGRPI
jgi:hypothetical protein